VTPDHRALFDVRLKVCADELARRGIAALGPLFDLVAERLLRFARLVTRHDEDAEDVLQSALVRTALHPEGLAGAVYPWAYLVRTVRNEALRLVSRRAPTEPCFAEPLFAEGLAARDDDDLARQELASLVRVAMADLPAEQGEVLVLKLWEGLTFAEIAEVVEAPPNTVASRYRYALDKLAPRLRGLVEAEEGQALTSGTRLGRGVR
jgi:RNA polymerase sigma-70 factor, ECF subfamily